MTALDLKTEHEYRVAEYLGIMCGSGQATGEQLRQARAEADKTINELKPKIMTEGEFRL